MTRATTQKLSSVASNAPPKSSRKSFDVSHHVDAQSSCDLYSINCSNAQIRDTGTGFPVEFTIKFLESNKEPSREMGSFHCLGHELGRKTLSVPALLYAHLGVPSMAFPRIAPGFSVHPAAHKNTAVGTFSSPDSVAYTVARDGYCLIWKLEDAEGRGARVVEQKARAHW